MLERIDEIEEKDESVTAVEIHEIDPKPPVPPKKAKISPDVGSATRLTADDEGHEPSTPESIRVAIEQYGTPPWLMTTDNDWKKKCRQFRFSFI